MCKESYMQIVITIKCTCYLVLNIKSVLVIYCIICKVSSFFLCCIYGKCPCLGTLLPYFLTSLWRSGRALIRARRPPRGVGVGPMAALQ